MLDSPLVRKLVRLAIEEDLSQGDITSELALKEGVKGEGSFLARERMIVCGIPLLSIVADELKSSIVIKALAGEGRSVRAGERIAAARGRLADLLAFERTALNFLQRLCAIASYTRKAVNKARSVTILDTRKTIPGHRMLDKYAVRVGGAKNHRLSLGDMILVKNNHVDANRGDISKTLERVYAAKPPYMPVEVEVRNLSELSAALSFKPQIIMLDNMSDTAVRRCVHEVRKFSPRTLVEVSGGVQIDRLPQLARAGVTLVSIGALTNKAPAVDISFRITVR